MMITNLDSIYKVNSQKQLEEARSTATGVIRMPCNHKPNHNILVASSPGSPTPLCFILCKICNYAKLFKQIS